MLLFLIIKELQERGYDVTVALQSGGDVLAGSKDYRVSIDERKLKVVHLSECGRFLGLLNRHLHFLWQWRLRRLGPKYDICISCANPVDFGRPGIHFIYMLTLDEAFKEHFWKENVSFIRQARFWCICARDAIVKAMFGVRSVARIVRDSREVVLPNSDFVRRCIDDYYGSKVHSVFYPPTVFMPVRVDHEICNDIAYIGRFEPEKRIQSLVSIVGAVRKKSGVNLRLRLAGKCPATDNGHEIEALAQKYDWVKLEGPLYGDKKAEFLASCRFALHGCKVEAFGISITEYLKAGLVPVVPQEGGSSEVVDLDDLVYRNDGEATLILCRLIQDREFYERCVAHCRKRAEIFSVDAYKERQRILLHELGV